MSPIQSLITKQSRETQTLPFDVTLLDHLSLDPQEVSIQKLNSFSNDNYLVNQAFVVRLTSPETNQLNARKTEEINLKKACLEKFCPLEIVYFNTESGTLISKFLKDYQVLTFPILKKEKFLEKAARLIKKIHQSSLKFDNEFQIDQRLKIASQKLALPDEITCLIKPLQKAFDQRNKSLFHSICCHNDLSPENFVKDHQENLFLIDWESAGLNDAAWDIAFLCALLLLDEKQENQIRKFYASEDLLFKDKVLFFKPFIHMGSILWAYEQMQQATPKLPLDFIQSIYFQRIQEVKQILASQEYFHACHQLSQ